MNAFLTGEFKPAGAYYFPVHDSFSEADKKNYVMLGKTVSTKEIIEATDNTLTNSSSSNYVKLALTKEGQINKKGSQSISEQDMQKYLKYALKISEKGVDEINTGFIAPTPYDDSCKFCPYGGMCGVSEDSCAKRKVKNVAESTITGAIDNLEKGIDFRTGKPTQVKMSTLQKIADACDVPVSYILNEAKKQSTDTTPSLSDLKLAILDVIDQIPEEQQRNFLEMAKLYASSHKKD